MASACSVHGARPSCGVDLKLYERSGRWELRYRFAEVPLAVLTEYKLSLYSHVQDANPLGFLTTEY